VLDKPIGMRPPHRVESGVTPAARKAAMNVRLNSPARRRRLEPHPMTPIYLDFNASTPIAPTVAAAIELRRC
jgi:hypothetical protein